MKFKLFKIPKITAWIFPRRIWFGPAGTVTLTFDDGPHPTITPWLLSFLKEKNIPATFFWLGENIERYPKLVEKALKDGHQVAYHGYRHLSAHNIDYPTFINNSLPPQSPCEFKYYRPPYGKLSWKQAKSIEKQYKIMMWSWMAYDFDTSVSVDEILKKAKNQIVGGEIIVLHENDKSAERMPIILPKLVEIIKAKELQFAEL